MKTTIFLVLGLLLMLSLNLEVKAYCQTNGCSIPGNLPFFYKRHFTPACNKHDVCYACGVYYGWSRFQCDNAFLLDMSKLCLKRVFTFKMCLKTVGIYYAAVRIGGKKYYERPSLHWCQMCDRSNGDPRKRVPLFGR